MASPTLSAEHAAATAAFDGVTHAISALFAATGGRADVLRAIEPTMAASKWFGKSVGAIAAGRPATEDYQTAARTVAAFEFAALQIDRLPDSPYHTLTAAAGTLRSAVLALLPDDPNHRQTVNRHLDTARAETWSAGSAQATQANPTAAPSMPPLSVGQQIVALVHKCPGSADIKFHDRWIIDGKSVPVPDGMKLWDAFGCCITGTGYREVTFTAGEVKTAKLSKSRGLFETRVELSRALKAADKKYDADQVTCVAVAADSNSDRSFILVQFDNVKKPELDTRVSLTSFALVMPGKETAAKVAKLMTDGGPNEGLIAFLDGLDPTGQLREYIGVPTNPEIRVIAAKLSPNAIAASAVA